jgi:tetratricopeptide (TPR) repeat protein
MLRGATGQQPAEPLQLVQAGQKLNREGKQADALALYEQALAIDPNLFEAHLAAGIALDLQSEYAKARVHLERALELASDETRPQAISALGVSYAFERNAASAAKYYQDLFDVSMKAGRLDGAAAAANALGRVYLESGDPSNAAEWYQRGYDVAKKIAGLPPDQVDLWELRWEHARSRIAARQGNADEAARFAGRVKAIVDKGGLNAEQEPTYRYLVGYNAFHAGQYDQAIAELLRADQEDPFILALLGQAYEKKGDLANARESYTRVLGSNGHSLQNAFARPIARESLARLN